METQPNTQRDVKKAPQTKPHQENLKGTFAAVIIVGLIILVSWFGIFGLFLDRA
ncbi:MULTISPECIES: cytochrome c oxidase subunit 2A [Brevibacillus]|uniref:Cytochrome c oxidase subunit 2A n=1 Tax=Brevibacillus invocatus TaxID=173959 RepID=A0A3M8C3Q9_9BACL|nr:MULTISPECIES: cytochrome c oxidase subunit 2A [Brevibacillus]MCM3079318.1 cytochrome c oxidase subunit 2A [Brevibacillus invocatus]MCM3429416.1 cytochrome c oxidase subunit 2A [Brevibacillus invocatus]MDH4618381.1 cytochrome c oxidase subunit 2A [Brevibacillus sp. AY1]RNB70284.1 cytochrome c oxidase subunit 2A [Brevibacillus invocatus]